MQDSNLRCSPAVDERLFFVGCSVFVFHVPWSNMEIRYSVHMLRSQARLVQVAGGSGRF